MQSKEIRFQGGTFLVGTQGDSSQDKVPWSDDLPYLVKRPSGVSGLLLAP